MKRYGTLLLVALTWLGVARAEQKTPPEPPAPPPIYTQDKDPFGIPNHVKEWKFLQDATVAFAPQKVKGTYLGVSTKTADATLRKQLQLPDGVGLVVAFVDPESPAKTAGLEVHDVLKNFDDQILINERQLLTLVRLKKPGENATLTLIRGGKETKMTVVLAEKDVVPLEAFNDLGIAPAPGEQDVHFFNRLVPQVPGMAQANWTQALALTDAKFDIQVETRDGKPMVIAKDKEGNVIYQGSGDAIPEEVRTRLGDAMKFIQLDLHQPPGDVLFLRGSIKGDPKATQAQQ